MFIYEWIFVITINNVWILITFKLLIDFLGNDIGHLEMKLFEPWFLNCYATGQHALKLWINNVLGLESLQNVEYFKISIDSNTNFIDK
jgi:hypothetical protein